MDQGVVDLLALFTKDNSAEIIIGDGAEDKVAYSSGSVRIKSGISALQLKYS